MKNDLWKWDAIALTQGIKSGKISCREVVTSCLNRLEEVNGEVNAVSVVLAQEALIEADEADRQVKLGKSLGILHGVPITTKENNFQAGIATTEGVVAFQKNIAETDGPTVANLRRAGAIIIGRSNMSTFGLRKHTDNELRGPTLNPWNKSRTPGGSSGGAAASVALGITPIAQANDFGGSIRFPAYCCGVSGLRPTLGRIPALLGVEPDACSMAFQLFESQGAIARRIGDLRLALAAMAVRDPRDPFWVSAPLSGPQMEHPIRVALTVDPAQRGVDPTIAQAIRQAGKVLEKAGYVVEEVEAPSIDAASELWWRLAWNEVRSLYAPYLRKYGDKGIIRALDLYLSSTPEVDKATYMEDLGKRLWYARDWSLFFERYPLVVGPVSTQPPPPVDFDIQEGSAEQIRKDMGLLVTVNLLGLPSVAVPIQMSDGVPIGVQIIGDRFREDMCLDAAEILEKESEVVTPINVAW
jgi:amidase